NSANATYMSTTKKTTSDVIIADNKITLPPSDTNYIPLEWVSSVYDAIRVATQAGRGVIEASGNGGRNLDAALYNGRFNRSQFNSGAIIVGAGDGSNARLSFSSYGSRVDVQAHGISVTTTGYGDLYGTTQNNFYTGFFNGTSSASAIVATAATTVQGYLKHGAHPVRSPQGMAILFTSTGSVQTGNLAEHIGPKPNLRSAIAQLDGPVLAPSVRFVGCTGFAGTASLVVTTNADATT